MPGMPQRLKAAYHRYWPPRPRRDAMSRNYRMKRRGKYRFFQILLLVLLLTTLLEIALLT